MTAVSFRQVEKKYPRFQLGALDLEIPQGKITGLIGPNGAGKSTLIRMLMGLVHQDRGEIEVLGRSMPSEQVAAKLEIGFASEDMRLYPQATVAWHMGFVRSIYPSWDAPYAAELLRRFDVDRERRVKQLSHGQRVKAMLLLVLARRPKLLVLDEPTTGLDPVARHEVFGELMEVLLDEERTILFSSHNTQGVEQISDQITFLDRGRIVDSAEKEDFLERWRRVRLEIPESARLPELGWVEVRRSGRTASVITDRFGPELTASLEGAGASIQSVQPLTLEEIFVARVKTSREESQS